MHKAISRTLDTLLILAAAVSTGILAVRYFRPVDPAIPPIGHRVDMPEGDFLGPRRFGPADAPLRLVVWTDYQCPACKRLEQELDSLREKLGDSLTVIIRHLPMENHPLAHVAAIAAECALPHGRFQQMHRALFGTKLEGDSLPVRALLDAAGIGDVGAFERCVSGSEARASVTADVARAKELELIGTPSLQYSDWVRTGGLPAAQLEELIRSAKR